jgi:hypothetical protein
MIKRFRVQFKGDIYFAEGWKDIRTIIKGAYPLVMQAIEIQDTVRKTKKTFIIRRDNGRVRVVKDGGRSVIPTLRGG